MSTIKVLHVIARMNVGGTARYVGDLVENIPASALATGYVQESEIEDPIVGHLDPLRIAHMGRRISPINDFKAWLELRRIIKELKPRIVHTHTFKAGLLGRLVGGDHKRVHTFHGHLFGDQAFSHVQKKVITFLERYLAKRTDLLISVGEKVGVELRAALIAPNKKWVSIPPGVNALPKIDKSKAREILGLEQKTFLVGWMARMTSVKNPFLLLDVANRLPKIHFVMAGGGDLLEEVRKKVPQNVLAIGWADAATFWSAIDCAISTSDNEGMPIALIEAQLAGIPIIATDVGSNSEVIEVGVTGFVTPKVVDSIVESLVELLSDQTRFEVMSLCAKTTASNKFALKKMIEKHTETYNSLF